MTILTPTGNYLRSIGRNGEGPGEFGFVTSLQAGFDDSLFVFDAAQQRLTVFTADGSVVRTVAFQSAAAARLGSVTQLSEGVWLGRGLDRPLRGPAHQIARDTIVIGLLDANLDHFDSLVALPSLMSTTTRIGSAIGFGPAPFTPIALHATWGNCVFVSTAEAPAIRVYSANGEEVSAFEGPGSPRPIVQEHLDALMEHRLRGVSSDQEPLVRRSLRDAARPEHLPYYHQMIADQWGHLWLQEYAPPFGAGDRWYVLTQSGRHVGDVVMPMNIRAFAIDKQGVLGVTFGDLDEEIVVALPLISRPPEASDILPQCQPSRR